MTAPDLGRGIVFLGGGNMGRALIAALLRAGANPSLIRAIESHPPTAQALVADYGIETATDTSVVGSRIDTLVLAVKPQDMARALQPLHALLQRERPLVISVAAGLSVQQLQHWCGTDVPVVRAMPNRPALEGVGATGLFAPAWVATTLRERAASILATAGIVVSVDDESLMDVVTAVSGSGPAYFFRFAEALAAAGIAAGLSPAAATELARATLHGAGRMAEPGADLAALRESVTSKGGTTAAALASFSDQDLERVVAAAVTAAVRRGRELSSQAAAGG
ncbi:MAG: pyrroline-5-carboxylate reductase [Gammaproteobacteria bacterium]|jgi:pyrroline-5-carboxylate reductase|nr:pyrroline-5-carboxylate reductase [Gammaproteobacteria bacterium]NBP07007.1 pyrroline-5-carboxylate reductase [Gammaproteobacteria bacterium]NBR16923.1 pyrroline-5-carboxylate reductase [Gammaproteobacteria bacterium]NCW21812.1 pyrroline-5-carboxylate reductase [Gammaproteobacteria bacterium]NCW56614.1 pyrroline-5-carboxylate reductase [Gammaproteobacteria bacterium]